VNAGIMICAAALLGCTSASAIADQNLLSNGDFSSSNQVNGWSAGLWSSDDANGDVASGSIEFDIAANSTGASAQSACFGVVPGAAVSTAAQNKPVSGTNFLLIRFTCDVFSDANCQNSLKALILRGQGIDSTWGAMAALGPGPPDNSGNLPANALSARCEIDVGVTAGPAASMRFDNVSFNSQPAPTPVTLQEFNVD